VCVSCPRRLAFEPRHRPRTHLPLLFRPPLVIAQAFFFFSPSLASTTDRDTGLSNLHGNASTVGARERCSGMANVGSRACNSLVRRFLPARIGSREKRVHGSLFISWMDRSALPRNAPDAPPGTVLGLVLRVLRSFQTRRASRTVRLRPPRFA